ncbi:MAG: DUF721 domain-containing protein [Candidatus Moraniibacteriota bacterium]|nr:MAG: DUF721 domain-containing protein [Candidatus Moranbacteria bacterium]
MRSLKEFFGKRGSSDQCGPLYDKTVFFIFRKIIREEYGTRGAAELEPASFSEGVLAVKSRNPLYSNELIIRQESIREKINSALEQDAVQELRLVRYAA